MLGDSFHPGGLKLTTRLGELLLLGPHSRVLDVACGQGVSALHIAEMFGCEVVGIDYSSQNVDQAKRAARQRGIEARARFEQGDSERLAFRDDSFEAIICECAFCTFPEKTAAAHEFIRVLKPGGRVGLSDITRASELPPDLKTLMAWVSCIGDARTAADYARLLGDAGFRIDGIEDHDDALKEMVNQIRMKLLGLEIALGLEKLKHPGMDLAAAKQLSASALQAVSQGQLGYAIVMTTKA